MSSRDYYYVGTRLYHKSHILFMIRLLRFLLVLFILGPLLVSSILWDLRPLAGLFVAFLINKSLSKYTAAIPTSESPSSPPDDVVSFAPSPVSSPSSPISSSSSSPDVSPSNSSASAPSPVLEDSKPSDLPSAVEEPYEFLQTKVAGVTFKDGRYSRQAQLRRYYWKDAPFDHGEATVSLSEEEYEGKPAFAVLLSGRKIGYVPAEHAQYVSDNFDRCEGIRNIHVYHGQNDIYGAEIRIRFRKDVSAPSAPPVEHIADFSPNSNHSSFSDDIFSVDESIPPKI